MSQLSSPTLQQVNDELDVLRNYINGEDLHDWDRYTEIVSNASHEGIFINKYYGLPSPPPRPLDQYEWPEVALGTCPTTGFFGSYTYPASYFGYYNGYLVVMQTILYYYVYGTFQQYRTELYKPEDWIYHEMPIPNESTMTLQECDNFTSNGDTVIPVPSGYFISTTQWGRMNKISSARPSGCPDSWP